MKTNIRLSAAAGIISDSKLPNHIKQTDSKLTGNFPKTNENAYTENTQISVYTQVFTVGHQAFNGQSN